MPHAHLLLAPPAALLDIAQGLVMGLFVLTGLLLIVVVLLQEGKGGGIAGAFGGAGAEAFGVKAGTVNRFTFWLGGIFLAMAVLHAGLASTNEQPVDLTTRMSTPPTDDGGAPPVPPPDSSTPPGEPGAVPPAPPPAAPPPAAPPVAPAPGPAPAPAPVPAPAPAPAPQPPPEEPAMGR